MGEEEEEEGRHGGMNPTGSKVNGGSQQNGFSARAALTGDLTREKAAHQSPVGPRDPHLNQLWKLGGGRCRRALTCTGPLIAPPAVHALNPHSPTGDSGTSHFAPQSNLVGRTVKCDGAFSPLEILRVKLGEAAAACLFLLPPSIAPCWLPTLQLSRNDSPSLACFHSVAARRETSMFRSKSNMMYIRRYRAIFVTICVFARPHPPSSPSLREPDV